MTIQNIAKIVTRPGRYLITLNSNDPNFKSGSRVMYCEVIQHPYKHDDEEINAYNTSFLVTPHKEHFLAKPPIYIRFDAVENIVPLSNLLRGLKA